MPDPSTVLATLQVAVKIANILKSIIEEDFTQKLLKTNIDTYNRLVTDIHSEGNIREGLNRMLVFLEQSYTIIYNENNKFIYRYHLKKVPYSNCDLQNQLCFLIAKIHYHLGAKQEIINSWVIYRTHERGGFDFDCFKDEVYINKDHYFYPAVIENLLGKDILNEDFRKKHLKWCEHYNKRREDKEWQSRANDIYSNYANDEINTPYS